MTLRSKGPFHRHNHQFSAACVMLHTNLRQKRGNFFCSKRYFRCFCTQFKGVRIRCQGILAIHNRLGIQSAFFAVHCKRSVLLTGRRRGKLFTKSNEEAWQNRSDTTKAATPSAANRQGNEKISRPAIRKAADPLRLRCICITAPFSVRNPRQLPLGHRPRWYRAAVASASSQAPADDRSGAARFP